MSDPISDRMISAAQENRRAISAITEAARQVWETYQRDVEPVQDRVVKTLERHNPQLIDAAETLAAIQKLLDTIATEQSVIAGHLAEGDDSFKAMLIKSTTLSLGIKTLYNDADTMTEALQAITEPTLNQVIARLSVDDRIKLVAAIDRNIKRPGD